MRGLTLCSLVALAAVLGVRREQTPATGRDLYRLRCAACHGAEGRGDGPVAASLNPRPTNFVDSTQHSARTDSAVAEVIMRGRGAMPAFERMLTRVQVDSVVAYLRTLQP
jgi:mono/diheme cytochrome c family protein